MIQTTLKKEVLSKYLNPIFCETGTATGSGVKLALECGFKEIYSIEIDPDRQIQNEFNFSSYSNVHLITGDSSEWLEKIVEKLVSEKVTFFLDGHWDGGVAGVEKCPLFNELSAIKKYYTKGSVIMLDDVRLWGQKGSNWGEGISEEKIKEILLQINPDFKFTYEDGWVKSDILVAH